MKELRGEEWGRMEGWEGSGLGKGVGSREGEVVGCREGVSVR